MKRLLFIVYLFTMTAWWSSVMHAQTVTTVQWWFDSDYENAVSMYAKGKDFVWRHEIRTTDLSPGLHHLHIRFKDSEGYWSGVSSQQFLKVNHSDTPGMSVFEYWYGEDFENRKFIVIDEKLGQFTSVKTGFAINLPMEDVSNGLHQLNFRIGYADGFYSPVSSSFFYRSNNAISEGNMVIEYWVNDNYAQRKQQTFTNLGGLSSFNIDLSDFKEGGLHRLNYRVSGHGDKGGYINTDYFFNNNQGANVLEWTFNDEKTVHTRLLNSATERVSFELNANHLNDGVHRINFRTGRQNGTYSPYQTAWFVKGFTPFVDTPYEEEQLLSEYTYWFDSPETAVTVKAPAAKTHKQNRLIEVPKDLSRGKHLFYIQYKDNYGQLGELYVDTFAHHAGPIHRAKIKNLEPNINPNFPLTVKEYATIYRYYKVLDENDIPVTGARILFKVGDYLGYSTISDEKGVVVLSFNVWGNLVDDENDDVIPVGTHKRVEFSALHIDGAEVEVYENELGGLNNYVTVQQYQSDESTMELGLGVGGKGGIGRFGYGVGLDTKLSFTNSYDEFSRFAGTAYTLEGNIKAAGKVSGEMGGKIHEKAKLYKPLGGLPSISAEGGLGIDLNAKFKQEMEIDASSGWKSYLAILYDIAYWTYISSGMANENLDAVLNVLGGYLRDADFKQSRESKVGAKISADGNLNFTMNIPPVEIDVIPGATQLPLLYNKLAVDIDAKAQAGFETGSGYKSSRSDSRYTKYNFLSFAGKMGANFKASEDFEDVSFQLGQSLQSSVKLNREHYDDSMDIHKASLSLGKKKETEVEVGYQLYSGKVSPSKEYNYKYTVKKPFLDYLNEHPGIVQSLPKTARNMWAYLDNKASFASNASLVITPILSSLEDDFTSAMNKVEEHDKTSEKLNKTVSMIGTKRYTGELELTKKIESPKWLKMLPNFKVEVHGSLALEGKYPMMESYWHFGLDTLAPVVVYKETDPKRVLKEASYYFAPFDRADEAIRSLDFVVDKIKAAVEDKWDDAVEKANEWYKIYTYETEKNLSKLLLWLGPWTYSDRAPGLNQPHRVKAAPRQYSPMLSRYDELKDSPQQKTSLILFDIPCANDDVFEENTEIQFNHYYPGGELLGATAALDTFIVISDIAFLSALHKWDTLDEAPNGNFKIYAEAGEDDLTFLGINDSYPIGVYHKSYTDSLWNFIGQTNDTIHYNKLGKYCLGVNVSSDKTAPVVTVDKEDHSNVINIRIEDNMAVLWSNVMILLNGLFVEYEQFNGNIELILSEEQLRDDVYITVYASDLARNETVETVIFKTSTDVIPPLKLTNDQFKLNPNPARDRTMLTVPEELLSPELKYAVLGIKGEILNADPISSSMQTIDITQLKPGVYFVVVFNENEILTNKKLIKR